MGFYYFDLTTTDPAYNLAMEQYVFDCLPREHTYFMLWQNDNAIIIGRHQNTAAEINAAYVEQHGIRVVRRLSGGGAVYHDLGNLNFTFITDEKENGPMNFSAFCRPVIRTLAEVGVTAELNGRNDMTIGGQKFSGNAQYKKMGRVMHHGTILFDSDLSVVSKALQVDPAKFQAKGIQSVRSRVTNVREHLEEQVSLADFRRLLLQNVLEENGGEEWQLTEEDLAAVERLREQRYSCWEWNFGRSPIYTKTSRERIEGCGTVVVCLVVDAGIVKELELWGDFFHTGDLEEVKGAFGGCRACAEAYREVLEKLDISQYIAGLDNEVFLQILRG